MKAATEFESDFIERIQREIHEIADKGQATVIVDMDLGKKLGVSWAPQTD